MNDTAPTIAIPEWRLREWHRLIQMMDGALNGIRQEDERLAVIDAGKHSTFPRSYHVQERARYIKALFDIAHRLVRSGGGMVSHIEFAASIDPVHGLGRLFAQALDGDGKR